MGWFDAIGAVASAGIGLYSADKAADAQQAGYNQASNISQSQYNQQRADLAPWMGVGQNALRSVGSLYGVADPNLTPEQQQGYYDAATSNFQATPGYQFRLDQGTKALDNSASARGMVNSGQQQKAITNYGQGMASAEYGNYINQLNNLAGLGQTASSQVGVFGGNAANQQAGLAVGGAQGRASGYANQAGALNTGIKNLLLSY